MSPNDILAEVIAAHPEYKFGAIKLTTRPIMGHRVGYAGGSKGATTVTGYIVIDSRFAEYGESHPAELRDTIIHELAHLVAETANKTKKRIWHGQAWKDAAVALGGSGERYYTGSFKKPEASPTTTKTKAELYAIMPTKPATEWEHGTFRQWLERGYHVIKGQKGQVSVWSFQAEEYETKDGKTSDWGRASAVYFTPDQVEPNQPKVKA